MTATLTVEHTTAVPARVSLPELDFGVYRQIVATMQDAAATDADRQRIGRAVNVLLTSQILETETCGVYLIQSAQDSGLYYRATSTRCGCPDTLRRGQPCKHSHALAVLSVACAIAAREDAERRYLLTARGELAIAATATN